MVDKHSIQQKSVKLDTRKNINNKIVIPLLLLVFSISGCSSNVLGQKNVKKDYEQPVMTDFNYDPSTSTVSLKIKRQKKIEGQEGSPILIIVREDSVGSKGYRKIGKGLLQKEFKLVKKGDNYMANLKNEPSGEYWAEVLTPREDKAMLFTGKAEFSIE